MQDCLYIHLATGREDDKATWRPFVEMVAESDSPWLIQRSCRILFRFGLWWAVYIISHKSTCTAAADTLAKWRGIFEYLESNPHRAAAVLRKAKAEPERLP